jgi:universal stress protein F
MPRTIVVPVDLSLPDTGAKAVAQAKQYDPEAKLVLLFVAAPTPGYVTANIPDDFLKARKKEAQKALSAFADRTGVTNEADLVIRTGHPGREILSYAEETNADLIVIASHDPRWGDFLLGSVAAFVVRHAHCSVLVVRAQTGKSAAS